MKFTVKIEPPERWGESMKFIVTIEPPDRIKVSPYRKFDKWYGCITFENGSTIEVESSTQKGVIRFLSERLISERLIAESC